MGTFFLFYRRAACIDEWNTIKIFMHNLWKLLNACLLFCYDSSPWKNQMPKENSGFHIDQMI